MTRSKNLAMHWTAMGLFFVGCTLPWLPDAVQKSVASHVRDALLPGQTVGLQLKQECALLLSNFLESDRQFEKMKELESELVFARHENRRVELRNVQLTRELASIPVGLKQPFSPSPSEPLVIRELIEASVFARTASMGRIRRLLLKHAKNEHFEEEMIVLEAGLTVIDQGRDQGLEIGQPVYAGATVVGRVESVGRWISSIMLVTDAAYRGRAQLARQTSRGLIFGMQGRIEGQGTDLCRLHEIPATESVAVGDQIFTGESLTTLRSPLFYGSVVRAELPPGAEQWLIEVKPAFDPARLQEVAVLRESLNTARLLSN